MKRIEEFFNVRDVNKNGYVELNDFRIFAENLKKLTNNERPEALQRALDADLELAAAICIKEGDKLNKDQWIDALATTAADFNARSKRAGETFHLRSLQMVYSILLMLTKMALSPWKSTSLSLRPTIWMRQQLLKVLLHSIKIKMVKLNAKKLFHSTQNIGGSLMMRRAQRDLLDKNLKTKQSEATLH